jgi:GNAT superfamily N-acetyltransferase
MSDTTTHHTIHRADADAVSAIGRTLARAFHEDPVFRWCFPDPARRAEKLPQLFELFTTTLLPLREVETIADRAGVALWVPPGHPPVPDEAGPAFESEVARVVGDDAERTFAIMAMLDAGHPSEVHRFLWFVGVDPREQGRGLGSALLASMLTRCDRDAVPAYLDATAEDNRRLYERHGFEVVAEQSVDGCPPLWGMWRDPR